LQRPESREETPKKGEQCNAPHELEFSVQRSIRKGENRLVRRETNPEDAQLSRFVIFYITNSIA
jgi:hypothetical protein